MRTFKDHDNNLLQKKENVLQIIALKVLKNQNNSSFKMRKKNCQFYPYKGNQMQQIFLCMRVCAKLSIDSYNFSFENKLKEKEIDDDDDDDDTDGSPPFKSSKSIFSKLKILSIL